MRMKLLGLFGARTLGLVAVLAGLGLHCGAAAPEQARQGREVRIALVSDVHICDGTNGPVYRARFERAIASVNEAGVDVVMVAGDLTENGRPGQREEFLRLSHGFKAPVCYVPGNHDVGGKLIRNKKSDKRRDVNAFRVARYEMEMGPSYYVRELGGVRVVGVNGSLLDSGLGKEARMWQLLERELFKPSALPTVALVHYPPFVKTADEPGGEYWNVEPYPRARLMALLKQGHVRAVLSGHLHRPVHSQDKETLFVTTQPVAFGLPEKKQPEGWTLVVAPSEGLPRWEERMIAH